MNYKKFSYFFVVFALILFILNPASSASDGEDYSNVAALLDLGNGARPLGMGGAFVGLADDENAIYYNPAGLAFKRNTGFSSFVSPQFGGINYGTVSIAGPYYGINMKILDSGSIEETTSYGSGTGEFFRYFSGTGLGAVAFPISDSFALGTRLKYYRMQLFNLSDYSGSGWAIEPGLLIKRNNYSLGIVFKNALNWGINYSSGHKESLKRSLQIGVSINLPVQKDVNFVVDGDIGIKAVSMSPELNLDFSPRLGGELCVGQLAARVGINDHASTFGTSLGFRGWKIDWAYAAYHANLPDLQRVSLTYRF
mgnify:CR=1 FL=1